MSRAYKDAIVDDINDLSAAADLTSADATASVERMSGADLAQFLHSARNGGNPTNVGGQKVLGTNLRHSVLANVTADGVNNVTVDTVESLYVGQVVDILSAVGGVRADNRTLTAINPVTRVVTYSGADQSAQIVATDFVAKSVLVDNAALSGADMERFAGLN